MVYTRVGVWIPQCPPKNWEARSWSGDGRRPSGALHATGFCHSIELALLFLFLKVCGFLGLGGALLARTVHRGSIYSGEAPGKAWIVFKSRILELGLLQVNSTVSSIELSFLCLDSIESGGRAGASGLGSLPPSLRVVFSFPWLERRGSVRLLGREPPWSGEKDLLLRNVAWAFFFLLEEPETFFSKLLILLTILSMDFCIFQWLSLAIC
ncbi:unnamed protein product [Microthlaspi erraticum]|uniref:Uncharacterized protein n=1 Tax=Microthlaspi erraticum TaxID=1685480 RepID=A0A6D2IAN4_9BRAS|nr:unnamed protein product [Microthlaspi erraticum]